MRRLAVVVVFVVSVGLRMHAHAAEQPPIRSSYAAISGAFAPIWIAQEKGLFAKYGVSVDLKYILPATATQALISRSLDICNPGGELIEAGLTGHDVVFMLGVLNRAVFSLYSKPDIKSFGDLKGKIIGVTQPGSTTDFVARILARQAGMTAGKDVRVMHLDGIPAIMTALSQGNIDAGVISAPTTVRARKAGLKELVNIAEKNIPMIHVAFASTRQFMKENPDSVRKFLQAYLEGLKIARTDGEQAKQAIGKYTKLSDNDDLEETYKTFLPVWEKVPYVSTAGVKTLLEFANQPAAKTAKPEQFIDNTFLAELDKSGFIDKLY
ncbi:MAG TPA: ABC transporter substrate-binding protein [Candidatus Binatia bacterium]|jgi:NitT/TauT family transport system substrate-binding protein|nr:ABC transporter substrate-binding protein [Candidatus Binatia bacterium]